MLVGLHRERDVGVPEPLADDLEGDAVLDEQTPVGVAKIMIVPMSAQARLCRPWRYADVEETCLAGGFEGPR